MMFGHVVAALVCGFLISTAQSYQQGQAPLQCGTPGQADILFILDSSGSVAMDYPTEKEFAANLTSRFTIGPNAVQFAALIFSTAFSNEFGFTAHQNRQSLQMAIRNLPFLGQATTTGAALRSARQYSFTPNNGARSGVPKIAVVITDGNSQNGTFTSMEAYLLQQSGVTVFAIGVGSRIRQQELDDIASSPSYSFNVSSFSALDDIKQDIEEQICNEIEDPMNPPRTNGNGTCISTSCLGRLDGNYQACDPDCQSGIYYSCVNEFAYEMPCSLGRYQDSDGRYYLAKKVWDPSSDSCQLEYSGCPRNPLDFLESYENVTTGSSGTGNPPSPPAVVPRPCLSNTDTCLGREDGNYPKCAPECESGFYYTCANNETLERPCFVGYYGSGQNRYRARYVYDPDTDTCKESVAYCPRNPAEHASTGPGTGQSSSNIGSPDNVLTQPCNGKADILLIMDSSGSIGRLNFVIQKRFVAEIVRNFETGPNDFQFSAIDFSNRVASLFAFNRHSRNKDVRQGILGAPYFGYGTNTASALTIARIYSFTAFNGARPNVPKYALVITDGGSQDPVKTAEEAQKLKNAGVNIISIGVGSQARESELVAIASLPSYVFRLSDFNALNRLGSALVARLCEKITYSFGCIRDGSCLGRPDGRYPACDCRGGTYYSCVSEFAYENPCAVGRYLDSNQDEYYAPLVYDHSKGICVSESTSCPRNPWDYRVSTGPPGAPQPGVVVVRPCMKPLDSCYGKDDGNYPMCYPDCQSGRYITCSNGEKEIRPCPNANYVDENGYDFTARMVFNTETNACEAQADYCPRDPRFGSQVTIDPEPSQTICPALVDIIFVMDASGSVGLSNYTLMIEFVIKLATKFRLGPYDVRIGAVVYSSMPEKVFDLKDYNDHGKLAAALRRTSYIGGSTHTNRALDYVRAREMFSTDNGGRDNAKDVIILLTDGLSNRPSRTLSAAKKVKALNVEIITVGIAEADDEELKAVASQPNYVFKAADFNALDSIESELTRTTCEVVPECKGRADILLVMDASGSIGPSNFNTQKSFVSSLVQPFVVGPDDIQFAAITFNNDVNELFDFDTYSDNDEIMQAILGAPYNGGGTNTSEALMVAGDFFSSAHGSRPNAGKLVIIITDGQSNEPMETAQEASKLKASGVTVIAIGIGSAVRSELESIASTPSQVFMVNSFDVLAAIRSGVVTTACQSELLRRSCITFTCKGRADGDYPACDPECRKGKYFTCRAENIFSMPCAIGNYADPYQENVYFQAPLVYNPDTKVCEYAVGSCPRDPRNHIYIDPDH